MFSSQKSYWFNRFVAGTNDYHIFLLLQSTCCSYKWLYREKERRTISTAFFCLPLKLPSEWAPLQGSPERSPMKREMPASRAFFLIFFGVPNKQGLLIRRKFHLSLKVRGVSIPPPCPPPNGAPTKTDARFQGLPVHFSHNTSEVSLQTITCLYKSLERSLLQITQQSHPWGNTE